MNVNYLRREIISSIRELLDSDPKVKGDVDSWYDKAKILKNILQEDVGDLKVPHIFWHYLEDADIRIRDSRYAKEQISQVRLELQRWSEQLVNNKGGGG